MNRKVYFLFFISAVLFTAILFPSCEKGEAEVPSYIRIDTIYLKTNYSSYGTASHKIEDAWVYKNDQLVGAFELPAEFPVLASGENKITIRPGILKNGSSDMREYYFFYQEDISYRKLVRGEVLEINPTVRYKDNIELAWHEDFESAGNSFEYHPNSDTVIKKTSDPDYLFEGTASGIVNLDEEDTFFEWISPAFTDLPANGRIFLEMNYKTSHELIAGLYINGKSDQFRNNVIRPKEQWNKIYLELTDMVARYQNATDINVFVGFQKAEGETATVAFDNIKLIHFK